MKVEIWSDIMCPFCYIGKRKFEAALKAFDAKNEIEMKNLNEGGESIEWYKERLDELNIFKKKYNQETYLIDGLTSPMYETDKDRTIIDVSEIVKQNGESYD